MVAKKSFRLKQRYIPFSGKKKYNIFIGRNKNTGGIYMDTNKIGKRITAMRKERGFTQESLAELLDVSPQAVSKWENGHALPETALLPLLAKALETSIDSLFAAGGIQILSALYGDGIENHNVANRLNKLTENDTLEIDVSNTALACSVNNNRVKYLTVKYQTEQGVFYAFAAENSRLSINAGSKGFTPAGKAEIIAAVYGVSKAHYDVMNKIEHYKVFAWGEYSADHETFPSDPSNDDKDYLTFVYLNRDGIHLVTCEEGESIAYNEDRTELYRKPHTGEYYIPNVPMLPGWGDGHECSWAAALTAALLAMGHKTTYEQVMGVSGACYRLAFCSPGWDYSSVDGLVAYDYAAPAFKAFGYKEERHGHIEKADRAAHRERMMKEIRANMPILGINLRVAAEWGAICGYKNNGADFLCRTKYDADVLNRPDYEKNKDNPYDYLYMDNWPFLISYFADHNHQLPSDTENLINSLKVFIDCSKQERESGYRMGFGAYEIWRNDLLDDGWYDQNDDEQLARRFSVDQFCTLALYDARAAAYTYLSGNAALLPDNTDSMNKIAALFKTISEKAEQIHKMLDSGEYLEGARARKFWTRDMRHRQADLLAQMLEVEREAVVIAEKIM
jgi:transcriptional regulator with XRE-family HTH domain